MSDNGKTEEQKRQEKIDQFNANPDDFICLEDIIVGYIRKDNQRGVTVGKATRSDLILGKGEVEHRVNAILAQMDYQMMQANKSKIIQPGFKGGVRKFFKR